MNTMALNSTDMNLLEAYWTILSPLKANLRRALALRLEDSFANEELIHTDEQSTTNNLALSTTETLETFHLKNKSIKVPGEENGKGAVAQNKYML